MSVARLHETIAAVCPILGISDYDPVAHTAIIRFDPSASGAQQTAANSALASFDWTAGAETTWANRAKQRLIGGINAVRLSADQINSTVSFADCTGLSFDLAPNSHYAFDFVGAYTAAAATTGLQIAVNGPASPNLVAVASQISTSATAVQNGVAASYDTGNNATASGGSTALPFWIKGNVSTGANGGTFTLRFRSEVAASAVTIKAGSYGLLYGVN